MILSILDPLDPLDREVVAAQLGRPPRAIRQVAHRCPCGNPDVVQTSPELADGTPFPTLFYVTCPKLSSAIGRLEASGLMREMSARLKDDAELAAEYQHAHDRYLARRAELGDVPRIDGISAGGMPNRVKCLHVLVGHSLAVGRGENPLGDEALALLEPWGRSGPCVTRPDAGNRDAENAHAENAHAENAHAEHSAAAEAADAAPTDGAR